MRLILLLAVSGIVALADDGVEVKQLSATQQQALKAVSEKLAAAQAEYDTVARRIKAAYGQSDGRLDYFIKGCTDVSVDVSLVGGKAAVIRRATFNRCGSFAPAPVEPLK
jgi:hypothetical protein